MSIRYIIDPKSRRRSVRPRWHPLFWWPIPRLHQVVFAQALAEALDAGLDVSDALDLVSQVHPSWRLRRALAAMRLNARAGYRLDASLARTGAWVKPQLLAALQVGEEHAALAQELFAFARTMHRHPPELLRRAMFRRAEATRFAAAMARLLHDEGLTVWVIEAAGAVAAAGSSGFTRAVQTIAQDVESGSGLAEALRRHPRFFDSFYCGLLEAMESREQLRRCLDRLGQTDFRA